MSKQFSLFILVLLAAAISGCATTSSPQEASLQQKLTELRAQQKAFSLEMSKLKDNLLLVEVQLKDQQQFIEQLQNRSLPQNVTTPLPKADSNQLPAVIPEDLPSPAEIYRQAFSHYTSSRYPEAIEGFESFLRYYPNNPYAANALFWLGECYFSQRQYDMALEKFQQVSTNYPQGAKAPEALLKMASVLLYSGRKDQALATIATLQRRYPKSAAAKKTINDSRFSTSPEVQ